MVTGLICLLVLLLLSAGALALWAFLPGGALRRAAGDARAAGRGPVADLGRANGSDGAAQPQSAVVLQLPTDLQHLPEPPVLAAAAVQILEGPELFRRLQELELGAADLEDSLPEHEQIVAAALAAIDDAATQRRYTPRRPNLLPQLMRAVNDEDVSRRHLTAIIARDPSLVGSLLKMANSPYYRTLQPVETIERAIVILGSDGLRSLITTVLMQPIFQVSSAGRFPRFPEIVWEHALRSAHAAIPHAAIVERADAFAAELLCLISGLAEIVLFRAAMDHCASTSPRSQPDPAVIASLLRSHWATFAWRIAASWELSELMLAALEEQMVESEPMTALGRSLRFGRCAGALAVLHTNSIIDDATVKMSLPEAGLSPAHLKCMWARLLSKPEDPRAARRMVA
ncbi:MAG: HDOD domain-containing protein [Sinobacteraceae bacterium]|nr:HDOD domain-containing protein [Nevskiaceae bacterium]